MTVAGDSADSEPTGWSGLQPVIQVVSSRAGESSAYLAGIGVAEAVEDVQGMLPRWPCFFCLACLVQDIAEASCRAGLQVAVAEAAPQLYCLPVAGDRLFMLLKVGIDVPQAVQGCGLTDVIPGVAVHIKGASAPGKGF
jgi:hypothetical protein